MTVMDVKVKSEELRARAAKHVADARKIQDAADGEPNGEQREKIREHLAASDEALDQAKLEERMAGIETNIAPEERGERLPDPVDDEEEKEERAAIAKTNTPEYVRAFYRYARFGEEGLSMEDRSFLTEARAEIRALTEGVDADGGYLAPEQLLAGVQRDALELEELAPLMLTINSNARAIRQVKGVDVVTFQWVAELEEKPEDQPTFGRVQIDAHTAAVIVRVSDELLEDSSFDLAGYLSMLAAEAKIENEEIGFVAGSGNGQPFGILTRINGEASTPNRYTTAGAGALAADDFMKALYALKKRHRRRATWVLGTTAVLAARLLKDTTNQYIWQPGLQAGQPDSILGKPVIESEADAVDNAISSGNDVGFVGDLRRYTVLRRLALQVKRLEELYAKTDEVGFRFRFRTGGDVQNTAAFRSLRVQ